MYVTQNHTVLTCSHESEVNVMKINQLDVIKITVNSEEGPDIPNKKTVIHLTNGFNIYVDFAWMMILDDEGNIIIEL